MKKQLERKRESIHEITVQKREWYINVSTYSIHFLEKCYLFYV